MKRVVRKQIWLPKRSRSRRLRRLWLLSHPTVPLVPSTQNLDFYILRKSKKARPALKIPHRRKSRLRLLYLASQVRPVAIPNVVGALLAAAQSTLQAVSLVPAVSFKPSLTVAAGRVISQNPLPGRLVPPGTQVALVVSTGAATVPNLLNLSVAAAVSSIVSLALIPSVSFRPTNSVPPGTVVAQQPFAGTKVLVGTVVFITVAIPVLPAVSRSQLPSIQDIVKVSVTVH